MRVHVVLTVVAACLGASAACSIEGFNAPPVLAIKPHLKAASNAYTLKQAVEALTGHGSYYGNFLNNTRTTYDCVDSRGEYPTAAAALSTPGGDFAELAAAIVAYHKVKKTQPSAASVAAIFRRFMDTVATPRRPFYYHTSDSYLQKAFAKVSNKTDTTPIVLPRFRPDTDRALAALWYDALAYVGAQGCGHVRHMMESPKQYGLNTPAEAAVPGQLIKAFYAYWWPTPLDSPQRAKVVYSILPGPSAGRAMSIVNNKGPACKGLTPPTAPSHGGSQQFIYNAAAVTEFRHKVLVPFMVAHDKSLSAAAMTKALDDLQGKQVGATLRLLTPLNALPVYQFSLKVVV